MTQTWHLLTLLSAVGILISNAAAIAQKSITPLGSWVVETNTEEGECRKNYSFPVEVSPTGKVRTTLAVKITFFGEVKANGDVQLVARTAHHEGSATGNIFSTDPKGNKWSSSEPTSCKGTWIAKRAVQNDPQSSR